jgi:hypothetical protein
LFFIVGCSDDAQVNVFSKSITKSHIKCMSLVVFPPDEMLENTLKKLYTFDENCQIKLEVSSKSGIVCNSNQNSQKKALSNFPSSYLKLQVKNPNLAYSYYIDLDHNVKSEDIEDAFARVKNDLNLDK